jgi:hypothetical protein
MPYTITARVISVLLVGLLAFSCTTWSALAGTHCRKKSVVVAHTHVYLYHSEHYSLYPARPARDEHEMCWLPSDGCDNNHSITN